MTALPGWVEVWRHHVAPRLPALGLVALAAALREDDPRIVQEVNAMPDRGYRGEPDWRHHGVRAACPLCFAGWHGEGLATVGEVEDWFGGLAGAVNDGRPDALSWLLAWIDETERPAMLAGLLAEVEREIGRREAAAGGELVEGACP